MSKLKEMKENVLEQIQDDVDHGLKDEGEIERYTEEYAGQELVQLNNKDSMAEFIREHFWILSEEAEIQGDLITQLHHVLENEIVMYALDNLEK